MARQPGLARFLKPSGAAKHLGIMLEELEQLHLKDSGPKRVNKLGNIYYEIRDLNRYLTHQRNACIGLLQSAKPTSIISAPFDG